VVGRRALVALVATAAAVLGTAQASSGIATVIPADPVARPRLTAPSPSTDLEPSVGQTVRSPSGTNTLNGPQPQISNDGHWQVFTSTADLDPAAPVNTTQQVFVRNLTSGAITQLSVGPNAAEPNGISLQPSISDDGRFVSFITEATNLGMPAGFVNALVVCDRDPTGASDPGTGVPLYDQRDGNGVLTNVCRRYYAGGTNQNSVVESERPQLSGNGRRIVWVRNTAQGGFTELRHRLVSDDNGLLPEPQDVNDPGNPVPVDLGANPPTIFNEFDPVLDQFGNNVAFVARTIQGVEMVLLVSIGAQTPDTTRVDIDPDNNNVFLGDEDAGEGEAVAFNSVSLQDFAAKVSFQLTIVETGGVNFAPQAAALALPTPGSGVYVVDLRFFAPTKSQLVSRDNAGNPVAVTGGSAMSPDGRMVAFTTNAPNASDGQDGSPGQDVLIARDLDLDTARAQQGLGRAKGALVTATASASCEPTAPAVNCASQGGAVRAVSFDEAGARVSFADSASDLVTGDSGTVTDSFVRTWQPALTDPAIALDTVQAGDSTVVSVPIQVLSFGPVVFGPASVSPSDEFTVEGSTCFSAFAFYPGDSCDVSVRFAPDIGTTGTRTATVSISSAQYPSPVAIGTLSARVIATGPKTARGDTVRGSVADNGSQSPTGGSESMISGNGRWQVFVSDSPLAGRKTFDPTPNDGNTPPDFENVYVRDLADPQHTVQISLHSTVAGSPTQPSRPVAVAGNARGASPDDDSFDPSITSDGRFVSFFTSARDVVPYPPMTDEPNPQEVLVVCDRDPSGTKDKAGNPVLDRPRKGTSVPDYACFPVESGSLFSDGVGANIESTPRLSGDGTRIAWVESVDTAQERVKVATLSTRGGKLHAPQGVTYVPSTIPGFENEAQRDSSFITQTQPELTEDGNTVVYWARSPGDGRPDQLALIETTLPPDIADHRDLRLDTTDNGSSYLGDRGTPAFVDPDRPAVSDDGTRVAFALQGPDPGDKSLVYVVTVDGPTLTTVLASRNNAGNPADGTEPALSGDGRYLAFRSGDPNMHNGVDPAGGGCRSDGVNCQIVARDLVRDEQRRQAGQPRLASELVSSTASTDCVKKLPAGRVCASRVEGTSDYPPGGSDSSNASIDATGSEISFDSNADDLVPGDDNFTDVEGPEPATDTFVHTWRPQLAVPTMDFGGVKVGHSRTRTFTISFADFGGSPANFGPISLGTSSVVGPDASEFTVLATTCTDRTLHEGAPAGRPLTATPESCTYKIRFTPAAPGARTANLQTKVGRNGYPRHNPAGTISYDPAVNNALTGFGALPISVANPSTVDFGTPLPEDPRSRTVTITNTGSAPLVVGSGSVVDTTHPGAKGDYTVDLSGCATPVPAGGSCTITVTFTGHRVGIRDASLVLTDNTLTGTTVVGLRARIAKPTVESNPAVSPVRRVVVVTGTGFAPHHDVEIGFDQVGQMTARAKGDGTFVAYMVILPNGPQGPRLLFGHSVGFSKTIAADFPFLVVLGSTDPGLGVVLRD
jgi:hypothetical protein